MADGARRQAELKIHSLVTEEICMHNNENGDFMVLWPEHRWIRGVTMQAWAADAIANGELTAEDVDLESPADCALALHWVGLITLEHQ